MKRMSFWDDPSAVLDHKREADLKRDVIAAFAKRDDVLIENHPSGTAVPLWALAQRGIDPSAFPRIRFGVEGSSDLYMLVAPHGRMVACELKHPTGGAQRQAQRRWQTAWEARGGIYVLARSVDAVRDAVERAMGGGG